MMEYKPVSDKLIAARVRRKPFNITVLLPVYAHTQDNKEKKVEHCQKDLTRSVENYQRYVLIVNGDWNVEIGKENIDFVTVMQKFEFGDINDCS